MAVILIAYLKSTVLSRSGKRQFRFLIQRQQQVRKRVSVLQQNSTKQQKLLVCSIRPRLRL